MCGDYVPSTSPPTTTEGSPPHVRGLPADIFRFFALDRITPACAGTTLKPLAMELKGEDHPRMCGDYGHDQLTGADRRGSPPHVRGLLDHRHGIGQHIGITPACAGTTVRQLTSKEKT